MLPMIGPRAPGSVAHGPVRAEAARWVLGVAARQPPESIITVSRGAPFLIQGSAWPVRSVEASCTAETPDLFRSVRPPLPLLR
jgi:hypothetical protein